MLECQKPFRYGKISDSGTSQLYGYRQRNSKGGLSYTYLTINELKAEEPDTEFYFLMGADSLADFRKWSHAEVIASKAIS